MDNEYKNISQLENFLSMMLAKSGASKHFFISRLPDEISKEWSDMVFADVNPMYNRNAFSYGSVSVFLYSRPVGQYCRKDVKAMLAMERKFMAALEQTHDPHYVVQFNWNDSDYDQKLGFYYNVINISIHVK